MPRVMASVPSEILNLLPARICNLATLLHPTALAEQFKFDARRRIPPAGSVTGAKPLSSLFVAERNAQRRVARLGTDGSTRPGARPILNC